MKLSDHDPLRIQLQNNRAISRRQDLQGDSGYPGNEVPDNLRPGDRAKAETRVFDPGPVAGENVIFTESKSFMMIPVNRNSDLNGKVLCEKFGYVVVYPGVYRLDKSGVTPVLLWPHPVHKGAFCYKESLESKKERWIQSISELDLLHFDLNIT